MCKKVRIGVLGNADIARRMVIPALTKLELFELTGIASLSGQNKKKADDCLKSHFFQIMKLY